MFAIGALLMAWESSARSLHRRLTGRSSLIYTAAGEPNGGVITETSVHPSGVTGGYRRMLARGKKVPIVITAIARELVGFI